jgi:hypothetical protein
MQLVLNEYPSLSAVERKAYLEMNEWNVEQALQEIRQDTEWEAKQVFVAVPLAESHQPQPLEVESK